MARAMCQVENPNWPSIELQWKRWRPQAQAALAALKPGDDLGNGLGVMKLSLINDVMFRKQAGAEEMRERCLAADPGMPPAGNTTWRNGYASARKDYRDAIRALPLEKEDD